MSKKVAIFYNNYFDFKNKQFTIGGVQTYITDLITICKDLEFNVSVYEAGNSDNIQTFEGYSIIQVKCKPNKYQLFAEIVKEKWGDGIDLVIYATHGIVPPKNPFSNSIAIQHGIYWDVPFEKKVSIVKDLLVAALRGYKIYRCIKNVDTVVCVDYNFINWYRTQNHCSETKLEAILNYTRIAEPVFKPNDTVNIIFARRLFSYRGTRIFTEAILPILSSPISNNITVTIAGTGPDEQYMREKLDSYKNVTFITYQSNESLMIHADKHIAVVPTVGSEGASLSLLEAMSAQCAVIASNVGGMTNVVLDEFNGLIVNAGDSKQLSDALLRLIEDGELRNNLAMRGYESVKHSFSFEKWKIKWSVILKTR